MNSYDKFKLLCEARGVSPSAAMIASGLSKALATKWKTTEQFTPNSESLLKLCKYFNISADYFLDSEDRETFHVFNEQPEVSMLFSAMKKMTPQQRLEVIHYAEYICPRAFETKGDK